MTSITKLAREIVEGNRQKDYGNIKESFSRIAGLWSAYTGIAIDEYDVAEMMMLLKISRCKTSPLKKDNIIDIIGYCICHEKLMDGIQDKVD